MSNNKAIRPIVLKQLITFILIWLGCMILGLVLRDSLAPLMGIGDLSHFFEELKKGNFEDLINPFKILLGLLNFCTYLLPAFIFAFYLHKKQAAKFLYLHKAPKLLNIPLTIAIVILAFPLASIIYYLNMQMISQDLIAEEMLSLQKILLKMNNPTDLILNLIVIGLIAGIGEELVFRGIFQRLFSQYYNNQVIGIWIAAIIFSLIHFQPEGFIPRALLGALFGYLLVWTGNLWVPIIGHITFNSSQILAQYVFLQAAQNKSLEELEFFPIIPTIISTIITVVLVLILIKINKSNQIRLIDNHQDHEFKN